MSTRTMIHREIAELAFRGSASEIARVSAAPDPAPAPCLRIRAGPAGLGRTASHEATDALFRRRQCPSRGGPACLLPTIDAAGRHPLFRVPHTANLRPTPPPTHFPPPHPPTPPPSD